MKTKIVITGLAVILAGCRPAARELEKVWETNRVQVWETNFVTITQTNVVTFTNWYAASPQPRNPLRMDAQPVNPQSQLKILNAAITSNPARGVRRAIVGRLQNQSSATFRSVRIIFNLVNRKGNQDGQALVQTFNLQPWQVWNFQSDEVSSDSKSFQNPLIEGEPLE